MTQQLIEAQGLPIECLPYVHLSAVRGERSSAVLRVTCG